MCSRFKSSVWEYFVADSDTPYVICNACSSKVKRGKEGCRKNWSSTPLWKHLQRSHPDIYKTATEKVNICSPSSHFLTVNFISPIPTIP